MKPAAWFLILLGCTPAPPTSTTPTAAEDVGELLTDVQHLVIDAAALHGALREADAITSLTNAYSLFERHLEGKLRDLDAPGTVRIEYRFGQLRAELDKPRGKPKALAAELDAALEAHRAALTKPVADPSNPAPATPTTGPAANP